MSVIMSDVCCKHCRSYSLFEVKGDCNLTCTNCGVVSNYPIYREEQIYSDPFGVYYGDFNNYSAVVTEKPYKLSDVSVEHLNAIANTFHLPEVMIDELNNVYIKYLKLGFRAHEFKHLYIIAACFYIISKGRTIEDICGRLLLESKLFHSIYKDVSNKLNMQRNEVTPNEAFVSAWNKLCLDSKEGKVFKKKCFVIYDKLIKTQKGPILIGQLQQEKFYSAIAVAAAKIIGVENTEKELLEKLNISAPTYRQFLAISSEVTRKNV